MSSHGHHHEQKIPRGILIGAGALLAASLALAAQARNNAAPEVHAPIQVAVDLQFDDRPDGGVEIIDVASGETVSVVPPEQGGFIRGVMRGMVRTRKLESIPADAPFRLIRHADGALVVEDPISGRRVDLRSFGRTNHQAFARLLPTGLYEGPP